MDTLGISVNHYPNCTADYPEKPKDEAPQEIHVDDLGDGEWVFTCVDCGAFVLIREPSAEDLAEDRRMRMQIGCWIGTGFFFALLRFFFSEPDLVRGLLYGWAMTGCLYLGWWLSQEE